MTIQQRIEAAQRNAAQRVGIRAQLRPVASEAAGRYKDLRGAQDRAKQAGASMALMQTLRHVPGFFPTPRAIVRQMLDLARLAPGDRVLEPSAGKGDIAAAVRACGCDVECIEFHQALAAHLDGLGFSVRRADFLEIAPEPFDVVLMNPPFERRQDEAHVRHATRFIADGGRVVAVVSSGSAARLSDIATDILPLPAGSFRSSERPTGVNTAIVYI